MAKYIFECSQGHEPETLTVEAESDDEAMTAMMELVRPHLSEKHPEMAAMGEEDVKNLITAGWSKEESKTSSDMGEETTSEADDNNNSAV